MPRPATSPVRRAGSRARRRRSYGPWARTACWRDSLEEGRGRGYDIADFGLRIAERNGWTKFPNVAEFVWRIRNPQSPIRNSVRGGGVGTACDIFHNLLTVLPWPPIPS